MAKTVTQVQLPGSNSPTFIIYSGEAYYVTQSVAKYDRRLAKTAEQEADIDAVRELYERARASGGNRDAAELPPQNNIMSFQHVVTD